MGLYGSSYDTGSFIGSGGTPAIGVPLSNPDPTEDYIASGPGRFTPSIPQLLPSDIDEVTRNFGHRTYEAMLTDPAVWSSYLALKLAILDGPVKVMPAIQPRGYRYKPPGRRGAAPPSLGGKGGDGPKVVAPDKAPDPREARAIEVAEFCEREIARLKTPLKATLLQLLDCMAFGNKLAEKTRKYVESGPDKGKLALESIRVKPAWAWKFVVDCHMDVKGVLTFVPAGTAKVPAPEVAQGGFLILPRDKFAIMTWLGRDHDPRGTSALRAAYDWWNIKRQIMPQYYKFLTRFGSPGLDYVLSANDTANLKAIDPTTGKEFPGLAAQSPTMRAFNQAIAYQNGSVIVRPAGSEFNISEPKSEGESFLKGFDLFDRGIKLAIEMQARASLEAKHGSKADSETAENTRGLIIQYGRESLGHLIAREMFYESIALNFGEDVAEELTPVVVVGKAEQQDKPAQWTAAGSIGFQIGQSQLAEMDADLDLPERDVEADQAAAMDALKQTTEITKPADAGPGGRAPSGGQGGGDKGASK